MFIGHYAVAFTVKKLHPQVSLGSLMLAALWLDLVWPIFLLLGIERGQIAPGITRLMPVDLQYYPFSHSLLAAALWGFVFSLIFLALSRNYKSAIVLGVCVLSHWLLDAVVHRPDLPLTFSENTKVGLGLWNSAVGTFVVEVPLFFIGIFLYLKATDPKDWKGQLGLWGLILLVLLAYSGQYFEVVPPSLRALIIAGASQWLLVIYGYWLDRHRTLDSRPLSR